MKSYKIYDIHNHTLHQVDDGSRSLEETIIMIKQYIEAGFSGIILTPHHNKKYHLVPGDLVLERFAELKKELENQEIEFEIYPGNEIQIDYDSLENIESGYALKLNNTRYVLCEFPFVDYPHYAEEMLSKIKNAGYIPIIAHPEKYAYVSENKDWLIPFIKMGCLVQINFFSFIEDEFNETCMELFNRNMIHLIGTDSHKQDWRSPLITKELEILKEKIGEEKFKLFLSTNPQKVINDELIESDFDKVIL